ncbi:unnamed protein product [Trichogramma brassicae]|uniref:Odorant receptor n=1 Tax=Trichogramma brassicae TaxID=86971 RepID=A0A6H5HZK3_9HYME|nr:unnamed protein product [Trichogramma brassicae]
MKSALRMCACWPSASPADDTLPAKFYRILVNVCVTFVALGGAHEILAFWGQVDMNETIECSLVVSALNMAVIRLIVFNSNAKEMFQVLDTMRQDWTVNYTSAEDRAVLRNRCRLSFKLAKIFISSVVITWALFSAMPYVEALHGHRKILPFRGYYFFDLDTASSPVYLGVYVMNFTLGAFGCSTIAAATSFSLIATIHASAKFAIVKKKFETIDWNEPEQVKTCVQDHQNCIKYAENVETVINVLALGQFVVSTGLICFAGFQVTTVRFKTIIRIAARQRYAVVCIHGASNFPDDEGSRPIDEILVVSAGGDNGAIHFQPQRPADADRVCPRARQLCVLCAQHKAAAAAAAAQLRAAAAAAAELPSFSDSVCVLCARRIYSSAATAPGSRSSNVKASRAILSPRLNSRAEEAFLARLICLQ